MSNKESVPLLSVVIPTRNRQEYAFSSVKSILRIQDAELEVVLQDNSDTRGLEKLLRKNIQDSRLRYRYTPTPLSFIANFDAAVYMSTGEYLCFIGDDDGINPEIMEATRWAKDNNIDTLRPASSIDYLWPNSGLSSTLFAKVPQETGQMRIKAFSGNVVYTDNEQEVKKIVCKGGQEYLNTKLPKLYHGIVKRTCLDRVREKTGAYFGGLSPDIYSAVSIAQTAVRSVSIDYPLTLPGACRNSGSVESQVGKHTGNLEDAPHFNNRGEYVWSWQVPRYYSVPTIWADSAIAALQDMGRFDMIKNFNVSYLAACCLWNYKGYRKIILRDFYYALSLFNISRIVGTLQLIFSLFAGPGRLLFKRIVNRLRIMLFGANVVRVDDVQNILEATDALTHHLKRKGYSFTGCVSRGN